MGTSRAALQSRVLSLRHPFGMHGVRERQGDWERVRPIPGTGQLAKSLTTMGGAWRHRNVPFTEKHLRDSGVKRWHNNGAMPGRYVNDKWVRYERRKPLTINSIWRGRSVEPASGVAREWTGRAGRVCVRESAATRRSPSHTRPDCVGSLQGRQCQGSARPSASTRPYSLGRPWLGPAAVDVKRIIWLSAAATWPGMGRGASAGPERTVVLSFPLRPPSRLNFPPFLYFSPFHLPESL